MIARVFPRKTKATPVDDLCFFGPPPVFFPVVQTITEIHISVAFTWDLERAEELKKQWEVLNKPIFIGGPAIGTPGGEFIVGKYLKPGYVITSRGCPNRCWYCSVWKREGQRVKEFPIRPGANVLDDNLLACSDKHIDAVFDMLETQKLIEFTGGLEAARLKDWHIERFLQRKPEQMFFAYDKPEEYEALKEAGYKLKSAGLNKSKRLRCYVLIGFPGDIIEAAEERLHETIKAGFLPMAMLWTEDGKGSRDWQEFRWLWSRPAIIASRMKNEIEGEDD